MVSRLMTELHRPLSQERLERYRPRNGSDLDMLATYFWNITLSEALQPSLQSFEIALRNGIHAALTATFNTDRWYDRPGLLLRLQQRLLADAKNDLIRNNKPLNPGRVIAELSFGFWTGLLNSPYELPLWGANTFARLRLAFPSTPRRFRSRGNLFTRADEVRKLRNRVMHCEPIYDAPDLLQKHQATLAAIGWISPSLRDLLILSDRFLTIHSAGPAQPAAIIQTLVASRGPWPGHLDDRLAAIDTL